MSAHAVTAVIVNYNTSDKTIQCLKSIFSEISNTGLSIVLVDNGSELVGYQELKNWVSNNLRAANTEFRVGADCEIKLTLIRNGLNSGFAVANNLGIKLALKNQDCEFIWILNNDVTLKPGALQALLEQGKLKPKRICGSTIFDAHTHNLQCNGGFVYNKILTTVKPISSNCANNVLASSGSKISCAYISGASMFFPRDAFEDEAGFCEKLFLYYEEPVLTQFLAKRGYSSIWCENSQILHETGASTGGKSSVKRLRSRLANYHGNLSNLIFIRECFPWWFPWTFLLRFVAKSCEYILRRQFSLFPGLLKAYKDFMIGNYGKYPKSVDEIVSYSYSYTK